MGRYAYYVVGVSFRLQSACTETVITCNVITLQDYISGLAGHTNLVV